MPAPVSYAVFLANVNELDLAMLTNFTVGQRIFASDATEADALFAQAVRLHNAGLILEVHRVYVEDPNGGATPVQAFDGFVKAEGKAYLAQLARERVALSRDPL